MTWKVGGWEFVCDNFYVAVLICSCRPGNWPFCDKYNCYDNQKLRQAKTARVDKTSLKIWQMCWHHHIFQRRLSNLALFLCISAVQSHYWRTKLFELSENICCAIYTIKYICHIQNCCIKVARVDKVGLRNSYS